jgi:hypothetical protein
MSRTWMNTSRVGRTRSRPVGRWDVEDIVEGGRCGRSAWDGGCKCKEHRRWAAVYLVPVSPFDVGRHTCAGCPNSSEPWPNGRTPTFLRQRHSDDTPNPSAPVPVLLRPQKYRHLSASSTFRNPARSMRPVCASWNFRQFIRPTKKSRENC